MNKSKFDSSAMTIVKKGWGEETWIVNKKEYCGKILKMFKGKKFSVHKHLLKDETFYIESGCVEIGWSDENHEASEMIAKMNKTVLNSGDAFYVPAGRWHQIYAHEDSKIYEFSTEHFETDSYRLIKGD